MNISRLIARHAQYRPDHPAIIFQEHRLSYREFHQRINRLAHALLGRGLQKGHKIATLLPNSLELLDIYWMAAVTGMVVAPLPTVLRGRDLWWRLHHLGAAALFTTESMVEHIEPLKADLPELKHYFVLDTDHLAKYSYYGSLVAGQSAVDPPGLSITGDDLYDIMYTSGVTGQPKAIMNTQRIRAQYGTNFAAAFRILQESVVLHTGQLAFSEAFFTMMPTFFQGATFMMTSDFDAAAVSELVENQNITHMMMTPSQIIHMLNQPQLEPRKTDSLQMIGTIGAALHRDFKGRLDNALPGVLHEVYSVAEGFATVLDRGQFQYKPDSVGAPPPLYELRVVNHENRARLPGEIGEIVGRGPTVTAGYYEEPEQTSAAIRDGWVHTGDMGYTDDDGFLYLVDRKSDIIYSADYPIYPSRIEAILVQHPHIVAAAVFGVPDEQLGQVPAAAVILDRPGTVSEAELLEWINSRIETTAEQVTALRIQETFPYSASGKVMRRVIRADYLGQQEIDR
jgi:long-chain acyl-CoA synthetase